MKLWKTVLYAVVLVVCATSCVVHRTPKLQITHVLAITQEGDTLKLPIDLIRPINYRIINYSYGSSWYRPYYNPHQVYYYNNSASSFSSNSKGRGSGNTNNNKNNNKSVPVKTFDKPKVPSGVRNIKIPD